MVEKLKGNKDLPSGGENQEIDVSGFKTLVFRANQPSQKVNFYNLEENECLFKLAIYTNDKQLWKSGYIQSSDGYYNIEIRDPLDVGEYEGKLIRQCYKEDETQLNSAVVSFKLTAKEKQNEKVFTVMLYMLVVGQSIAYAQDIGFFVDGGFGDSATSTMTYDIDSTYIVSILAAININQENKLTSNMIDIKSNELVEGYTNTMVQMTNKNNMEVAPMDMESVTLSTNLTYNGSTIVAIQEAIESSMIFGKNDQICKELLVTTRKFANYTFVFEI